MEKQKARISGWTVVGADDGYFLVGSIDGHPRQEEFKKAVQMTSALQRIDFQEGIAETENTIYSLIEGGSYGN